MPRHKTEISVKQSTRTFVVLCLTFIVGSSVAGAQRPNPVPRVAYVYLFDTGPAAPFADVFRTRLRELGWIEGKNIVVEPRDAGGSNEKLEAIMRDLVAANIDLIVAMCTPEAKAALKATTTIPIVVTATGDPVKFGLVASLARPGGNVTGVALQLLELSAKRVEMLREVLPAMTRATVVWNPVRGDNFAEVETMQSEARKRGVVLESQQVRDPEELDVALDALAKGRSQAFMISSDTMTERVLPQLVEFAARARIPAFYDNRTYVDAGGLMSYGPNLPAAHRRAAEYVDKILKGAKPADLPMERPTTFELVINTKTAKALGVTIPQSMLLRADEVIR
jgi:putative tryptophan/tyrosine transport system substrate-binding protein